MDLAILQNLLQRGLLGYQPINFDNGVSLGTGLQFFGRPAEGRENVAATKFLENPNDLHNFSLGNIFIPAPLRTALDYPSSSFYLPTSEADAPLLIQRNEELAKLYRHFVGEALRTLRENGIEPRSITEIGANNCLFEFLFAERGLDGVGVDIVDYRDAVDFLAREKFADAKGAVHFHHLAGNCDQDIEAIPKSDLGWSYAVALHQANPLIHIAELSAVSRRACFIMTPVTNLEEAEARGSLVLQFLSSNSYYQAPFPQNFDVVFMSRALIEFSLRQVGFDRLIEIPFPKHDAFFDRWASQHAAYVAIRDVPREVSIYDFPRSPERDGNRADPETTVLCVAGKSHNIVLYRNRYRIVPHGRPFPSTNFDTHPSSASLNRTKELLGEIEDGAGRTARGNRGRAGGFLRRLAGRSQS